MDFKHAKINKKLDHWTIVILLLSLCLGFNYLISKLNWQIDFSNEKKYSLSQESVALLNKIKEPVDIILTIKDDNDFPKVMQKFLNDFNILLQSIQTVSTNHQIRVTFLEIDSPHPTPTYLQQYNITEPNLIIVASQTGGKKTIFRYNVPVGTNPYDNSKAFSSEDALSRQAIFESGFYTNWKESFNGVLEPTEFRGEETLVRAILEVAAQNSKKNTVYFTSGHGESSPSDFDENRGFSYFKTMLEDQNLEVESLDLSLASKVPDNAKIVVIAGPKGTFQDQEVAVLRSYLNERGGKIILAIDPVEELSTFDRPVFGLRGILKEWGLRCHDMLVYDPSYQNFDIFTGAYLLRTYNTNNQHKIISNLTDMGLSIHSDRCRPVETTNSDNNSISDSYELIFSSKEALALSGWTQRKKPPQKNELLDLEGNIPIIAISEKGNKTHNIRIPDTKIAALGSSSILSNKYLRKNSGNQILAKNIIYWMREYDSMLEIKPRLINHYKISMKQNEFDQYLYIIATIPASVALLGLFVTWLRKEL